MGKQHKIATEVKAEILKKVRDEGVAVSQAAKDYGVSTVTIYAWLGTGAKAAPSWAEFTRLKRERDEYLRIIGDLTVQLSTAQKKS